MHSRIYTSTHWGIDALSIEVEGAIENALPFIQIAGLPGSVVKESRERVRACLVGLGYSVPTGKVLIHLAPADAPKQGSHFDLPISLCVMGSEKLLSPDALAGVGALGELTLDGRIRPVPGAVSLIENLENNTKVNKYFISKENEVEANLLRAQKAIPVGSMLEVVEILSGIRRGTPLTTRGDFPVQESNKTPLDHVVGQKLAKRALMIALAGNHHLLLIGPPGVGKSLLAEAISHLLPPLSHKETVELHKIYGRAGKKLNPQRPFRSPHHSISSASLLGGGSGLLLPGEVSLSHRGVLFLDEFPEFRRDAIEGLREPMQNGVIHLNRGLASQSFPAKFTLVAAMNPCPCGFATATKGRCTCSLEQIRQYQKKISGPILDRFDLALFLSTPNQKEATPLELTHQKIRHKIKHFHFRELPLSDEGAMFLDRMTQEKDLSMRASEKIKSVARTISILEGRETINSESMREACSLRMVRSFNAFSTYS